MDITKAETVLKIFDDIALRTENSKIKNIAVWAQESVKKDHKPTLGLVSFNLNHAERLNMINQYAGVKVPKEVVEMINGKSACLILDYHETPILLEEGDTIGNKMVFGVPADFLKKYRVAICDEIYSNDIWLELSAEIDIACLVINATMVMNQMERDWLKKYVKTVFDEREVALAITKLEILNNDEEVQTVRRMVKDSLKRMGISIEIYEDIQIALNGMINYLNASYDQPRYNGRVIRNSIMAMENQIKYLINDAEVSDAEIETTSNQLKKQKNTLELAGQLAAESIFGNALTRLKIQLCEGIRNYGRQMTMNIRKKIENAPLDQLESITEKIDGYISGSWDYYIKNMSSRTNKEMEIIMQALTKQMEMDAGILISQIDESARMMVYRALRMETNSLMIDEDKLSAVVRGKEIFAGADVENVTKRLQKEIRNMMLLSIPLFFVNPWISIGNILLSKSYGKMQMNHKLKDIQKEAADNIENICYENTELLVRKIEENFEDAARTGSMNIKTAYRNLVRQIENSLLKLKESQGKKALLKKYLNDQISTVFPAFLVD